MCFSAIASFGSATVLMGVGIATIRQTESRAGLPFACIPILFGLQQLAEGFLWLALTKPAFAALAAPATKVFLFFALPFWPLWVPLAVLLMEQRRDRERPLRSLLALGVFLFFLHLYFLFAYPTGSTIVARHIQYDFDWPMDGLRFGLYFLTTVVSLFLSGQRGMWVLGAAAFLSLITALVFYEETEVSVWCFFAAGISLLIWWVIRRNRVPNALDATPAKEKPTK